MVGATADAALLGAFAAATAVVTVEHENIDVHALAELERSGRQIRPGAATLRSRSTAWSSDACWSQLDTR